MNVVLLLCIEICFLYRLSVYVLVQYLLVLYSVLLEYLVHVLVQLVQYWLILFSVLLEYLVHVIVQYWLVLVSVLFEYLVHVIVQYWFVLFSALLEQQEEVLRRFLECIMLNINSVKILILTLKEIYHKFLLSLWCVRSNLQIGVIGVLPTFILALSSRMSDPSHPFVDIHEFW